MGKWPDLNPSSVPGVSGSVPEKASEAVFLSEQALSEHLGYWTGWGCTVMACFVSMEGAQ